MPDPILTIRAVTELIAVISPLLKQWGHNEEAEKLDARRKQLLDQSDARLDGVIASRQRGD